MEHLDAPQINCLNEERVHDLKSIFATKKLNTSPDVYLESSADAQLLLNIHVSHTLTSPRRDSTRPSTHV